MTIHREFAKLEAGAEAGNTQAADCLALISDTIRTAMTSSALLGLQLDGADSCERVAEALAVWIKESKPRAFADMTRTRYSVTGLDCSAEGMERLRDWNERILIAYPDGGSSPADLAEQWIRDMDSSDQGDGFDYEQAEHAIRQYCEEATESGYLQHKLGEATEVVTGEDSDGETIESLPFRLYLRDNAPESD